MTIKNVLHNLFTNYGDKKSFVSRIRAKRIYPLLEMIEKTAKSKGAVSIIDIGGTEGYWGILPGNFLAENRVTITIVNLPGMLPPAANETFKFVAADACDLALFDDNCFDIAHSNSVIEHVGDWERMVRFATELSRVATHHFVQTPNFWFPIEPHFMTVAFHWMPKPTRVWLILKFSLGNWPKSSSIDQAVRAVESSQLLDRRMFQELFRDSSIRIERLLGLPKSLIAIRK